MHKTLPGGGYRKDIDGLRAIAVIAVIFFHFGYLPNGYLGVDVFFVISGYLITKILYGEVLENRFSLILFYLRRIRRIIPLVLWVSLTALIVGLFVMLPDDLENLSQSVVATNFSANNILLWFTKGNYWNTANEYKPLMHTWSLGIEEQFYLIYPFLFLIFTGKRKAYILPVLFLLAASSLWLFLSQPNNTAKFYFIQFRFFELAFGGLGAILLKKTIVNDSLKLVCLAIIVSIICFETNIPADIKLFLTVISSLGIMVCASTGRIGSLVLENKLMTGIGKISFSLYMWHQVVLAYTRYCITHDYSAFDAIVIFIVIILLSVFSYFFIEQPFRNKTRIKTGLLLMVTGIAFLLSTGFSLYLYSIDGIIRDVPELDKFVNKKEAKISRTGESNIMYNSRIYELNKSFSGNNRVKILVIGDSFARDWANVLLESKYAHSIEISYVSSIDSTTDMHERFSKAKYIFFSELAKAALQTISNRYMLDTSKVWNVGTKNFGEHNGIFYYKKHDSAYCLQRTLLDKGFFEKNNTLKQQWRAKYIDLIGMVIDKEGKVPVFTPQCKFISQDGHHLTTNGAVYFAGLFGHDTRFKIVE